MNFKEPFALLQTVWRKMDKEILMGPIKNFINSNSSHVSLKTNRKIF
jgi:hypothetical protein